MSFTGANPELKYLAIGELGLAIVNAANNSHKFMKQYLEDVDEQAKADKEVHLFFEQLYFFVHLSKRSAFALLSETQMAAVQNILSLSVPPVAIDSYFAHWPQDMKGKMVDEFIGMLNKAEIEYVEEVRHSKATTPDGKLMSLFFLHASHLVQLGELEIKWYEISQPIIAVLLREWRNAEFECCVQHINEVMR